MSSRSPSPPYRGRRGGDAELPSMERLSLRRRRRPRRPRPRPRPTPYSPERRAASSVSRDRPLSPPPPPPSDASVVSRGLDIPPPQPRHKQESGSAVDSPHVITITATQENQKPVSRTSLPGFPPSMNINPEDKSRDRHSLSLTLPDASIVEESGSELDSPPYLTFTNMEKDSEPSAPTSPSWPPTFPSGSPTSPAALPPSVNVYPTRLPKYSSSDEEDPYFESPVDNFVTAAANTFDSTLSDDDIDYKAQAQRRCVLYAESALKHYNNDEKKEVKYELISGIVCRDMLDENGCYGHVNFTAKGNQHNSKEELFFAELRWEGDTPVTTCVVSLEGEKHTGGLRDSKYDNFYLDILPYDAKNCYACSRSIRHPKDGRVYEMGHVAMSQYYI